VPHFAVEERAAFGGAIPPLLRLCPSYRLALRRAPILPVKPENRYVVRVTSFCEYADTKPRKTPTWFALSEDRPLAVFAGIWTIWHGERGTKATPVEGQHELFGFLTTDANAEVGAVHPKAMPVILTTEAEVEQWMTAPTQDALKLQRPLLDGALKIVRTGEKEDPAA
jgi:putative SOS response-associated peptidase YedK